MSPPFFENANVHSVIVYTSRFPIIRRRFLTYQTHRCMCGSPHKVRKQFAGWCFQFWCFAALCRNMASRVKKCPPAEYFIFYLICFFFILNTDTGGNVFGRLSRSDCVFRVLVYRAPPFWPKCTVLTQMYPFWLRHTAVYSVRTTPPVKNISSIVVVFSVYR